METAEIVREFERETGRFPLAAVEAAVADPEAIIPELLRIVEDTLERATLYGDDGDGDYLAHLYAMFLLAQFRETRAYPLVVRFALLPSEPLETLGGDFVTENLGQVLASVCGGDLEGIQSIIENEDADEWARCAALGSLMTLVAAGQKSRDEIVSYFADLFRGKLVREWSHVWDMLVSYSTDVYPAELLDDIEQAYEDHVVDPSFISFEDVQRDLAMGKDRILARLAADPHRRLVDDIAREMGWWDCFREPVRSATPASPNPSPRATVTTQPVRSKPKIGRNEPCPCGSGKKYKKCCGR